MFRATAVLLLACTLVFSATSRPPEIKSAGPMAFGPNGVLFVGDSIGAAVFAIDTHDIVKAHAPVSAIQFKDIDRQIAGMLGIGVDQLLINDIKVNPVSKRVYISVSRGRGLDSIPVILRTDASGRLTEFMPDRKSYTAALLPNPPVSNPRAENRNPRLETITQLGFADGKVLVAGLSNEEFSSNLRVIPFPFRSVDQGASVEIYHGSHGDYETQAPVRTFFPWMIGSKRYIVAAYTCTPLVLIPVRDLKPGAKVTGTTIAELGMGNRPLDMIPYRKDNHDFILLANSYRGVMKLSAENLDRYEAITEPAQLEGVPYKRIAGLKGVRRLTGLDDSTALILKDGQNGMDLESIPLP
jgi:hypothetical protein